MFRSQAIACLYYEQVQFSNSFAADVPWLQTFCDHASVSSSFTQSFVAAALDLQTIGPTNRGDISRVNHATIHNPKGFASVAPVSGYQERNLRDVWKGRISFPTQKIPVRHISFSAWVHHLFEVLKNRGQIQRAPVSV
jgi:hypothetical protein